MIPPLDCGSFNISKWGWDILSMEGVPLEYSSADSSFFFCCCIKFVRLMWCQTNLLGILSSLLALFVLQCHVYRCEANDFSCLSQMDSILAITFSCLGSVFGAAVCGHTYHL